MRIKFEIDVDIQPEAKLFCYRLLLRSLLKDPCFRDDPDFQRFCSSEFQKIDDLLLYLRYLHQRRTGVLENFINTWQKSDQFTAI